MRGLVKRSFALSGHRTSVALEAEFWDALIEAAAARGQTLSALVAALDAARDPKQPLASALRVFALRRSSFLHAEPNQMRSAGQARAP